MKTFIGLFAVVIPYLDHLYAYLLALPEGILSPKVQAVVQGLGILLAAYGRLVAKGPIIK